MSNTMKRQTYVAPAAELVCLAPSAPVATSNQSWKWGESKTRDWTKNSWGAMPQNFLPSVTGVAEWLDDSGENPDLK